MMNTRPVRNEDPEESQRVYKPAQPEPQNGTATPLDGSAPTYPAPYPPYLTADFPQSGALSVPVASGLAYFTILPAIVFLLLQPYRSNAAIRFHSWQSIFYFLVLAAARAVESLMVSVLPDALAFTISALLSLVLFAGWLVATIKAFQGTKVNLPFIGEYAQKTGSTHSVRTGT